MSFTLRGLAILIWLLSGFLYILIDFKAPQKNTFEKVDGPIIRDTLDCKRIHQEIVPSTLLAERN
ncbi:hypothetical protein Q0590_28465 [Rhodocytophaga aerolata]|uniref:Uncharacterized protein n=1 Tax=Rhodocytophaga aerolata TaxID=455078 RepID=A0ABT8RGG7_9BACT|nr:hypothetical protein [Rhodocytophaga aerolata]MDO1450248.1 hypothetical protein [Rhodocytophaga aerolata]